MQQSENARSQELIHHHHHHHHFTLHIDAATGSVLQRLEQFLPDNDNFASKLLKLYVYSYYACISCDPLTGPLYQYATDFMQLVDVKTLSPVLIANGLLSRPDMEFLLLQTIIDSEKVMFIYVKLLRYGKKGYEKFMSCLQHPSARQHRGHVVLHQKLSSQH